MLVRVIVAIDEPGLRDRVAVLLDDPAVHLIGVGTRSGMNARLGAGAFDLALIEAAGRDPILEGLSAKLATLADTPQLVAMQHDDDSEARAQMLAAGALAVLDASLDDELLGPALLGLVAGRQQDVRRPPRLELPAREAPRFVYESPAAKSLLAKIDRIAPADTSVLILGETGVGKERVAELIHGSGPRAAGPFVPVNCGAIPGELFESELFGHERGAFTGAHRAHRGVFELAHGGTLFLDEVGEVPPALQVKLLRTLQERRIRPVGSERWAEVDVRVVAATNQDLAAAMTAGTFRRDLYYRLSVVELAVPPLRERPQDILAMAEAFVQRFVVQLARPVLGFEDEALEAIRRYAWPGNVRELLNAVERAVLLCDTERIRLIDLPASVAACAALEAPALDDDPGSLAAEPSRDGDPPALHEIVRLPDSWASESWRFVREGILVAGERAYLTALLTATGGKVGEAASRAGMSSRALFEKMRRLGLRKESFRKPDGRDEK